MHTVAPARHLLRAKHRVDSRYRDPLDVSALARAAELLRNTDRAVAEICFDVGLRSLGSFTSSFTRAYGCSPAAYRARHPPASSRVRIPTCVLMAYARPRSSTFGEDSRSRAL